MVWLVGECVRNHSFGKYVALSTTAFILLVCAVLTERQLSYWKDTVTLFERTVNVTPGNSVSQIFLAVGLEHEGLSRQAAVHYRIAAIEHPDFEHFSANFYLAELMAKSGYYQEAEDRLEVALHIVPDSTDAMNNLAWILATCPDAKVRNGARAAQWGERACGLTHDRNPVYLTTLAAAYAEAGRFDDAIATTQKAITLADQYGQDALSEGNQELLQTYTAHPTYAQTHGPSASQGQ
jgi:tetratricopeptide (TPR) repeat protein